MKTISCSNYYETSTSVRFKECFRKHLQYDVYSYCFNIIMYCFYDIYSAQSQCPDLPGIPNGYVSHRGPYYAGNEVTFHCHSGYENTVLLSSTCSQVAANASFVRWDPDVTNNRPVCTLPEVSGTLVLFRKSLIFSFHWSP